jgi:hypothetical protein
LVFFFDVSPEQLIHAYVRKIVGIMDAHFEQKESIRMPSDQEMLHQAQPCRAGTTDLGPVATAVDGFVVRTSGTTQPKVWEEISTSHQAHENVCIQLASDGSHDWNDPISFSSLHCWKVTDQRIWNDYKLRDHFVGKSCGVVADRGFILNPRSYL